MRRRIEALRAVGMAGLALASLAAAAQGPSGAAVPAVRSEAHRDAIGRIGRPATDDEVEAWDIDVRADFAGLPKGKGDVATGEMIWEAKCTSCHGVFGESNEVFSPLAGGTTQRDVETGRVANLRADAGFAQRTTLMKASHVSGLWDYINRAMPWTAPKSLKPDEVYAVLAYLLNLGDIVPADFTLTDANLADVQKRMPNRNGMVPFKDLWEVGGRGDVVNEACMADCRTEAPAIAVMPEFARDSHGNIAEQVRAFGPMRGTDISKPPAATLTAEAEPAEPAVPAVAAMAPAPALPAPVAALPAAPATPPVAPVAKAESAGLALLGQNGCLVCHAPDKKVVGPSLRDIAGKYAKRSDVVDYLAGKIASGGQGIWGPVPMPPQAQVSAADRKRMAQWFSEGAR